jgi:hypothetical protein
MWESRRGLSKSVGRVESRLYGFPCFPYSVISMACFSSGNAGYGYATSAMRRTVNETLSVIGCP